MPTSFLQGYLGDYAPPFGGGEGGGASELLKTYSRQSTQSVTAVVDNIIELRNILTK